MVRKNKQFEERHREYYDHERPTQNAGRICASGSQCLVHLLRGEYFGEQWCNGGRRPLYVDCGSGFNAVTLAMLGWDVSATEISPEIVEHARSTASPYGQDIDFQVGENESLPFATAHFDLLISMNVIHYCQSSQAVNATAAEYTRVLKPGGIIVLLTQHPDNWTLQGARPKGNNMVVANIPGDYRDGQELFLFRDSGHLAETFSPYFDNIRIGINRTEFFTRTLVHQVMVAECAKQEER